MRARYNSALSFVDFLFNLLLAFVTLFILSFLLINPVATNNKKIDPNAEFIVIMNWPGEMDDDVDLWVEDPRGNLAFFGRKEAGLMHLDRDDLGDASDKLNDAAGDPIDFDYNQETMTIRGYTSGEYVVNVFMYSKRSKDNIPVTVQVLKLNPYKTIVEETVELTKSGEEKTIIRFTVDSNGKVVDKNSLFKQLARIR